MACGCPDGYTPSLNNEECVRIDSVPANLSPTTYIASGPKSDVAYGTLGTNFYENITGRPLPISAISAPLSLRDATLALVNITNIVNTGIWGSGASPRRLNYSGIWTTAGTFNNDLPQNEWIGFSKCIEVPTAGVYAVGFAGDNRVRFRLNGVLTAQIDFPSPNAWSFNRWHVIPMTLEAGTNIIELEGYNDNQIASFGAEIYQATTAQLMAMTTAAEITAVTIFTTRDQIGLPFNIGENSGYSCPAGYALNLCGVSPVCSIIERTSFGVCSYPLINCETLDIFYANTDLSLSVGKIVTLENIAGCWTVGASIAQTSIIEVVVLEEFDVCADCVKICYSLIECNNLLPSIKTDIDLSAQVGKYIKIASCPKNCWLVAVAADCEGTIVQVTPTFSFDTCIDCNPPVVIPRPEVLHARKIRPGYDTPGCSPEYTERINCKFADEVYNKIVQKRYGISLCCEDEYDKYLLKKEILDLRAIYADDVCLSTCITCIEPCGVSAILTVYNPIVCSPPTNVTSILELIIGPCDAPTNVSSGVVRTFRSRGQ